MDGNNPWLVESIEAFSFLKCPECKFDTKIEHFFQVHATENHPLSFVFFGKTLNENDAYKKMLFLNSIPQLTDGRKW